MERRIHWFTTYPDRSLFCVEGVGIREAMAPGLVNRPSGTDNFLLMHFHDPVEIAVDGRLEGFPAETFVVWGPGDMHYYGNRDAAWMHSWMHCSGDPVVSCLRSMDTPLGRPVSLRSSELADRYLSALYEEMTRFAQPDHAILEHLLHIWMRETVRACSSAAADGRIRDELAAARRHIERHLSEPISLAELARVAGLSVSHLSVEFRRFFHESPIEYVISQRLKQAAVLLRDPQRSVREIAHEVGFDDQFYFSRQFRRRFGQSPVQYRAGRPGRELGA